MFLQKWLSHVISDVCIISLFTTSFKNSHKSIKQDVMCLKDNPAKMAESFRGDFYLTGDLAHQDEDGYFWFSSRDDDVIRSAG